METAGALTDLSETMQMYLKTVHDIATEKGAARVTDIARTLEVKKASVTSALRNLSSRKLVNYTPYDVVTLTEHGVRLAEELDRRYRVLHDFFVGVLGIDPQTADLDACNLEHHLSETLHQRLIGFIEYYQTCAALKFRWDPNIEGFCADPDDTALGGADPDNTALGGADPDNT